MTPVAPQRRGFRDDDPFYIFSRAVVRAALRAAADVRVTGMEHCPPRSNGGLILASNHLAVTDIPLIGAWCPRAVLFFSKSEVRDWPVVGGIGQAYGQIFARRGEADRQAIRETLACLAAGQVVGIFPEGHRSRGAGVLPAQPGIALLAARSGVPVLPVAVTGSDEIGKRLRPRVTVTVGPAFDPLAVARAEHGGQAGHQEVADAIMRRVAALLPPAARGVYA
jgi:1-acyl-sn-glycerol-3-phosphate acyltransferase